VKKLLKVTLDRAFFPLWGMFLIGGAVISTAFTFNGVWAGVLALVAWMMGMIAAGELSYQAYRHSADEDEELQAEWDRGYTP
jgi:hypothetical protein